jgi:DNA (cytosine-5)-methyltransferase 1
VPDKYRRRVWDAIGDLPDPTAIHDIPDHDYISVQGRKENDISALRWKASLVQFDGDDGRSKNSWIRLHPWKLSPIVMGKSVFIHPFEDRQITVREMARLQGFPDDFVFSGSIYEKRNQVGEAVSPIVSRYLARIVKERNT